MKTIKFFSFAMLLSLAWVACKDSTTASTESTAETTAVTAEALATNKTTATESLNAIHTVVSARVTMAETALANATEDTKANLTTQLENLKKFQSDIQAVTAKVSESTVDNWSEVAKEVEAIHGSVKMALTPTEGGVQSGSLTK